MRCPDCNKFVGIEMVDPEVEAELSDGEVTGTVQLIQTCADSGSELAEANIDLTDMTFEVQHAEGCKGTEEDLEVEAEAENNDRYEGKGRYAKHFYGADVCARITCGKCQATVEVRLFGKQ